MSRILAAILVICTQVLAVFGTGNLVLCIQSNGERAIELRGSECCRAAHEASERLPRRTERDAGGAVSASNADDCTDEPYRQDQPLVSHGTRIRSEVVHDAPVAPVAVVVAVGAETVRPADHADYGRSRAPPRGPVPRRSLPFVLRC